MTYPYVRRLAVFLDFGGEQALIPVGEMLRTADGAIYFEADPTLLDSALTISPVRLEQTPGPKRPKGAALEHFEGVFGVFADSLPDGWGLLLMSRELRKIGVRYQDLSPLDRLSYVGNRGMGALVYRPAFDGEHTGRGHSHMELATLAADADRVLAGEDIQVLTQLAALGGTAGGARPKVLVGVGSGTEEGKIISGVERLPANFEHWIVKFRGRNESPEAGIVEWAYAQTATRVGLNIQNTKLFGSGPYPWFGMRRFDRDGTRRFHMHSACGLLHAYFREPSLDYETLLRATFALTRRADDTLAAFRLATFNVMFHNRDDHSKNFAFLMDSTGTWRLSPAYDLTYSSGPGGEHTTSVLGEGRAPGWEHLSRLAQAVGISDKEARDILQEVEEGKPFLLELLKQYGIKRHPIQAFLGARESSYKATRDPPSLTGETETLTKTDTLPIRTATRAKAKAKDRRQCQSEGCSAPVASGRSKFCQKHGSGGNAGPLKTKHKK